MEGKIKDFEFEKNQLQIELDRSQANTRNLKQDLNYKNNDIVKLKKELEDSNHLINLKDNEIAQRKHLMKSVKNEYKSEKNVNKKLLADNDKLVEESNEYIKDLEDELYYVSNCGQNPDFALKYVESVQSDQIRNNKESQCENDQGNQKRPSQFHSGNRISGSLLLKRKGSDFRGSFRKEDDQTLPSSGGQDDLHNKELIDKLNLEY